MSKQCICKIGELTHIVIDTGYAPELGQLLDIESCLRKEINESEGNVTTIFACDTNWHLGVLVPNPFGFVNPSCTKPKNNKQIIDLIDQLMVTKQSHPFYQLAKSSLMKSRQRYDDILKTQPTRKDLYDDLLDRVIEWTLEPINPTQVYTYADHTALSVNTENDSLYDGFVGEYELTMEEGDQPIMSYNDRLVEAQTIIQLLGGTDACNGTLCFKVESTTNPFEINDIIKKAGLSYCATFGLEGFNLTESGSYKILTIKYDAEHG
jgi:hypothetical protein